MSKFFGALVLAGILSVSGVFAAEEKADAKAAEATEVTDETEVCVIKGNKTYHLPTCAQIAKAEKSKKTIDKMTVAKAKEGKLAACKKCIDKKAAAKPAKKDKKAAK